MTEYLNSENRNIRQLSRRILMASTACVCMTGAAAYAQDAADNEIFEEIVIIADSARAATKTDAKIMEIPQAISVITEDQFKEQGATNFQDIFRYSAGVATELAGIDTRYDSFSARGFGVAQYIDGLNRMPDFVYGARMEVFTLERAEVLRGPSAVLYGAGGSGGILNAVSKTPNFEFGGEIGVQFGTDDRKQFMVDVTGGVSDTVATRFVGLFRDAKLQAEDQADDRILIMPSVTWSPGPDTDITLLVLYQKDDMGTQTYLPLSKTQGASKEDRLPIDFFVGDKDFNHMDTTHTSGTLMIDHRFTDWISYSGRMRYYEHDVDYAEIYADTADGVTPFNDADETIIQREFYVLDETYKILNSDHNVKFDFNTGVFEHKVLVGVDYTQFKQDRREGFSCDGYAGFFGCYAGGSPAPLDLTNPDYYVDVDSGFTNGYDTKSTQLGIYLQDQIKYKDRVTFIAGIRRDRSTSEISGVEEEPNHATTLRFGVIVDVGGGLSPYAGYSESFQPVFGGDFYGNAYNPQAGKQYEVGVKYQPNKSTLITMSYFDITESGFLTTDPDNIQNFIQSGEINSKGFEFEALANVFETLTLTAAYSYTKAEITSDNQGREGFRVEDLPEHGASFWAMNDFVNSGDMIIRAGAGVRYVGSKIDYYNIFETPSVTLVDATVEAFYKDWSFRLNANNVLNKKYYAACSMWSPPSYGACSPGIDRRIVATVSRKF
ncbi:TonB-dependent siderophore receptor [Kordiimonas pumila]|uniref:TonB-dependent siderophore receptor n=1 Tax=Kordiimonas pumila TaxID=2161677 RepID=A0ABV7D6L0_9PROT|nr:TonB-dependent siderophore receptor [Kordiimonas pumila]